MRADVLSARVIHERQMRAKSASLATLPGYTVKYPWYHVILRGLLPQGRGAPPLDNLYAGCALSAVSVSLVCNDITVPLLWQRDYEVAGCMAFVVLCCVPGSGSIDQLQVAPEEANMARSSQDRLARGGRAPPTSKQGADQSDPGNHQSRQPKEVRTYHMCSFAFWL